MHTSSSGRSSSGPPEVKGQGRASEPMRPESLPTPWSEWPGSGHQWSEGIFLCATNVLSNSSCSRVLSVSFWGRETASVTMTTGEHKPCTTGLDSGPGYKIKLSHLITALQLLVLRDNVCVCVVVVVIRLNGDRQRPAAETSASMLSSLLRLNCIRNLT